VSASRKLKQLVRTAATQFKSINAKKYLSAADKLKLKTFFLDRVIGPKVGEVLHQNGNGSGHPAPAPQDQIAGRPLLTARQVETWLRIDVKTLYKFAQEKTIPHVRLQGNVRFPLRELQEWVSQHSHVPPEMRRRQPARYPLPRRSAPARVR
jgi:excisionase family DNA binding protein